MEYYKNLQLEDIQYIDDDGISKIEEWRNIIGYEELYMISDLGRVKSLGRYVKCARGTRSVKEMMRKIQKDKDGYSTVTLCKNGKVVFKIHRLVAIAFIPNPLNLPEVNHLKNLKRNNTINNLVWVTSKENKEYSILIGLNARGEKQAKAKLTEKEVLEIRSSNISQRKLAVMYNVEHPTIGSILRRKTWKHI